MLSRCHRWKLARCLGGLFYAFLKDLWIYTRGDYFGSLRRWELTGRHSLLLLRIDIKEKVQISLIRSGFFAMRKRK